MIYTLKPISEGVQIGLKPSRARLFVKEIARG
jgi:hypothetical protein